MEPQLLTLDEVLEVYRDQIKRFGGTLGCMIMRSRNRLWPLRNQDSAGTAFTANCSKWLRPTQHSSNNTSNRSHPASPILPPPPLPRRALGLCQRRHLFYPGSLGVQDGGNLLLLKAFAYPDVTGITFVLLWRFRELIWIGIGLPALAVAGRGLSIPREDSAS